MSPTLSPPFPAPNEDACVIFIEQAYDPTELRGDEDETFHQDDAARVSMNRMDMMIAIKELPAEGVEGVKGVEGVEGNVVGKEKEDNTTTTTTTTKKKKKQKKTGKETFLWLLNVLTTLDKDELGALFALPVPLDTPQYFDVVQTPMDLSTIAGKVDHYGSLEAFYADVRLMVVNCQTYNEEGSGVYGSATRMQAVLASLKTEAAARWKKEEEGEEEEEEEDEKNTYRELVVTKGTRMSDLVTAIRTWRRPIQIKMRRPRAIRAKRRTRKTTQKHVIKKNYGGGGRRGGGRAGQLKKIDWYLVKWTQMSFKHVSWEQSTHINDDLAVAKFHRYQSPPTQSRTDAKRQLEVKQRYRENVKMPFKWETTHPITHTPNTPDEDDVAFVLADVVRRVACKPMLADGWSLYRSVSFGQSL